MAHFAADETSFSKLKDRVVVFTGAATGIGAAAARILAQNGAKVVIGDLNTDAAQQLSKDYDGVSYTKCDVTQYDDIYSLFKKAHDEHGHIDHAVSSAGIFEVGNWYDPNLTIETVQDDGGNTRTIDVNLMGTLRFARIASVFLRTGRQEGQDRSLTLLSSVNAWRESPGLFLYQVRSPRPELCHSADQYRLANTRCKACFDLLARSCTNVMAFVSTLSAQE